MTSATMQIECPACAGQGGAGTYCEDCDCTGMVYALGCVADELATVRELADMAQAALAAMTQRAEAAEAKLAAMTEERDAWRVRAEHDGAALAAVPVEAIRHLSLRTQRNYQYFADMGATEAVKGWLNAQPQEAQP